ncbi:hypothetical protein [Inhella proteolytica]|uniref:Uncharacterized protein n=1 Tax=Inhella proteolytica TaxID=2795029 RepID=A0A931J511_9BURK|nr:hypothetical protein [Inhella proteolytica]MBH9578858.1 hypothetical protein [Inhella proteolytica]
MKQKQIPLAPGGRPRTRAKRARTSQPVSKGNQVEGSASSGLEPSPRMNVHVHDPVPLALPASFPTLTEAQYRELRQRRRAYLAVMLAALLAFAAVIWTAMELDSVPTGAELLCGFLLCSFVFLLGYWCVGRWMRILHCPACDVRLWDSDPERNLGLFARVCPHCHKPFPPRRGFG